MVQTCGAIEAGLFMVHANKSGRKVWTINLSGYWKFVVSS